jgi:hypothetical protein
MFYYVIDLFGQEIGLVGTKKIIEYRCAELSPDQYSMIPIHALIFDQEWLRKQERKKGRDN